MMSVNLCEGWFLSVPISSSWEGGERQDGLESFISSVPQSPKTSSTPHFCQFLNWK